MAKSKHAPAQRPMSADGLQYHLHTGPNALAPLCILVGAPERATLIAEKHFTTHELIADHRGFRSYTGDVRGTPMSVVTTGMGGASAGMVIAEAVQSGARIFIRVGTCGALRKEAKVGHVAICTGAVRFDGASDNWAPVEWPAVADFRVVAACARAAEEKGIRHHLGIGVTTSCFRAGQARPDDQGYVPERLLQRHREMVQCGALFYDMETAALLVWCATHGGYPIGTVNTILANRVDGRFKPKCDEQPAIEIAIAALSSLVALT